jgi:transketolase N-terminal domain/subunit
VKRSTRPRLYKLSNLVAMVDVNRLGQHGPARTLIAELSTRTARAQTSRLHHPTTAGSDVRQFRLGIDESGGIHYRPGPDE